MSKSADAIPDRALAVAYRERTQRPLVITLDGPAGAGKSTTAGRLSGALAIPRLDSGALYRSLALHALEEGVDLEDGETLGELAQTLDLRLEMEAGAPTRVWLAGREVTSAIRSEAISHAASKVSVHPAVRAALLPLQRQLAEGGVVAEGRDMGSVVFPDAALKVYLTAEPLARGERRLRDLAAASPARPTTSSGVQIADLGAQNEPSRPESRPPEEDQSTRRAPSPDLDRVVTELRERDARDSQRAAAPLVAPAGSVTVDTSALSIDEVESLVMAAVRALVAALQADG